MSDYYSSILPEQYTVLCRELKPLTLGHLNILQRLDCVPVVDDDSLILAVLVCSTDATTLEELFNDRFLGMKLWLWKVLMFKIDWDTAHELFSEYFDLHLSQPSWAANHKSSSDKRSGTPFNQVLRTTCLSKLNYDCKTVLTTPWQQMLWDYLSYHEAEGNIDIMDVDWRKKQKEEADKAHDDLVAKYGDKE